MNFDSSADIGVTDIDKHHDEHTVSSEHDSPSQLLGNGMNRDGVKALLTSVDVNGRPVCTNRGKRK